MLGFAGAPAPPRSHVLRQGVGYFLASSLMLVANKAALRAFPFPAALSVVQYAASALAVQLLAALGAVDAEPLVWAQVRRFWTVTLVFCLTIFANMLVLQRTTVETVIVFRCTVPLVTSVADYACLGLALPSGRSWSALLTVLLGSSLFARATDAIDPATVAIGALYVFLLSFEMVYVKHVLNTVHMSTYTRVLYNNALSVGFGAVLVLMTGEPARLLDTSELSVAALAHGAVLVSLSCALGLAISFFGFGFRSVVSATTFTVVGVMCKVVSVGVSLALFHNAWSARSMLGLLLCLCGGALYKQAPARRPPQPPEPQPQPQPPHHQHHSLEGKRPERAAGGVAGGAEDGLA